MSHIVYTCPDGVVAVCHPAPEFTNGWLAHGGYWWDKPRGWADAWIARRTAEGRQEWAVAQFARKVQLGGCSTSEAMAIIRDFDCSHLGTGFDLWSVQEFPDRWFRNAWRRSHNGGPIFIDMEAARKIQLGRIASAIDVENKRRGGWLSEAKPLRVSKVRILNEINKADSPEQLQRIWPDELKH